jgi:hypothetical protein
MAGACFYRVTIHLRRLRENLKIRKNVRGDEFPRLQGINRWREGRTGKNGIKFGEPVAADTASNGLIADC